MEAGPRQWGGGLCVSYWRSLGGIPPPRSLQRHPPPPMSCTPSPPPLGLQVDEFKEAVLRRADVAIMDQNIDFGPITVLGTGLLQELAAQHYRGMLCIRSANSTEADREFYKQSGAHCVMDKALCQRDMIRQMKADYFEYLDSARFATDLVTSTSIPETLDSAADPSPSRPLWQSDV